MVKLQPWSTVADGFTLQVFPSNIKAIKWEILKVLNQIIVFDIFIFKFRKPKILITIESQ